MATISILTPVYNAEEYIETAIKSVLTQTFQDWELLCVDDESKDNSLAIIQKYAKLDMRIKWFTQKNTGPLGARRLGFKHSTGNYIIYLDADDYYTSDLLESVYKKAIESDADAIAPDMIYKSGKNEFSWNQKYHIDLDEELSGIDGFSETFPWRKLHNFNLWKRDVFQNSIYHPYLEGNNFNADEILQRILLLNCQKIVYSKSGSYVHVDNDSSITKVLQPRSFNRLSANDKLIQLGIDYKVSQETLNKIYGFCFFCQLKNLMLDYYAQPLPPSKKHWAMDMMKKAYHKYASRNIRFFYGKTKQQQIKALIQTCNFQVFKLICKIQSAKLI